MHAQEYIVPIEALGDVEGLTVIIAVALESQAARSGVEAGMIVRSIDGKPIAERLAEAQVGPRVGQAAVGCSVIAKWTTRRRSCASSRRTKSTRPVTVGTVKKSIDTVAAM